MSLKSKEELLTTLSDALSEIAKHKDQQKAIEEYLAQNHNMLRGSFIEVVAQPDKVNINEKEKIAVFVNAIYEITSNETINPKLYFSAKDIKSLKQFKFENEGQVSFPYTISSAIRVTNEDYLTALSYKELAALENHQLLTYNFDTQRLAKKTVNKKTGEITRKKDIKNASVNSIMKLMKEGKYSPSTLLFNVLVDGNSSISFDDGELTIHEGSTLNIIDGAHRLEAIVRIIEEDPEFEGYMNVDLKYYPIEKAQKLLAVTNTVNRFDKTLVKYYGGEQFGQEITKHLMTLPVLKDRIEIKTAIDKKITITNFAIVSESIQSIFNPQNSKDRYDVQDVLKKFYEYLIPSYEDQLVKNRIKNLEVSWISHHNMHVGFIAIAKKLYDKFGKDFPVDSIIKIIDGIDFDRESSGLTPIMAGQGKANAAKVKKEIREFIEQETDRILR
ncbi:DNA sulfur modification protein DndB [Paenibacillus odorifer]|uniref:DNA sulfur modification protein DndB n=1 Tax=Paenibacillus odorifer TaxID=189426 RepID=UPI00096C2733|nr:DNA sulfur modification protein DndB [Paenibacillus odorifer]OME41430.1 hypothetical protein BSK58_14965 [Paenibacillus odorifer]